MEGQKRRKSDEEDRVEITYRPAKQIVILDYFQFSKESLIQMFAKIVHSGLPVMAQWAEGVLFVYSALPSDTNELMENYLERKIFWSSANFALMAKYSPSIKVAGLEVPVIDVSDHRILREAAR